MFQSSLHLILAAFYISNQVSFHFFLILEGIQELKMVKFTAEDLRRIMDKKNNIRNMSVAGHLHHGMFQTKCIVSLIV